MSVSLIPPVSVPTGTYSQVAVISGVDVVLRAYAQGLLTRGEARQMIGLPADLPNDGRGER